MCLSQDPVQGTSSLTYHMSGSVALVRCETKGSSERFNLSLRGVRHGCHKLFSGLRQATKFENGMENDLAL
ncbi:hypothetical protein OBBRIDRAFT_572119 [Obba rivulosa]|uniref:Uncharacterized protein n=1 Tax=Obba rivulosa TaxID=1052685 RepID=A0A8E2AZ76_9APHY|nr:hypothetical protein OBBRIDRAFT_572119 [Obba rivulosa]